MSTGKVEKTEMAYFRCFLHASWTHLNQLADCGNSLPLQEAAIGNPGNPRRFRVLPEWKKAMDGFFHGQLDQAEVFGGGLQAGGELLHLFAPP